MSTKAFYHKLGYISIIVFTILLFNISIFNRIYTLNELYIPVLSNSIHITENIWHITKILFYFFIIISSSFVSTFSLKKFFSKTIDSVQTISTTQNDGINLFIGNSIKDTLPIYIPEKGLFQNILITGTIGTGKTSSAMYPFVKQLLGYNLGMLILDVKGNFYSKVLELNKLFNRNVIVIELGGKYTYNPLDKPNLKPSILANRIRTILSIFSNQHVTDTYWLDKVELYLTECIKLCRVYNNNYVTFIELHKLVNEPTYLEEKILFVKNMFLSNSLTNSQIYDVQTALSFFQNEVKSLDSKVLSIIKSEITRITQIFVTDLDVSRTFCPQREQISFSGFKNIEESIVVLNMNVAEYRNLSKIIATYLKLDFQSEVLMRLANSNKIYPVAFICDEYHEYATLNDADFFAQSREAKCISIISTQSYTSLVNAVKDQNAAKVIIQSLVNKIWFRNDDTFTIEEAQKQLGKEDKVKISHSMSENAKETKFNYILNTFKSDNSSLSESISTYIQHDFIFDFNTFSRELNTFEAVCFLSTGKSILLPQKVQLLPLHNQNKFI